MRIIRKSAKVATLAGVCVGGLVLSTSSASAYDNWNPSDTMGGCYGWVYKVDANHIKGLVRPTQSGVTCEVEIWQNNMYNNTYTEYPWHASSSTGYTATTETVYHGGNYRASVCIYSSLNGGYECSIWYN